MHDPFRPLGKLLYDLQTATGRAALVSAQRDRRGGASNRITHTNPHTPGLNRKFDSDLITRPTAVPDRVGDQFTRDQQSIRLLLAPDTASVKQLYEQTPRHWDRARLSRQRDTSLDS